MAAVTTATCYLSQAEAEAKVKEAVAPENLPNFTVDNTDTFSTVIIGGGTAGCTVAYLLAKWMEDENLPGTVLLVDRG